MDPDRRSSGSSARASTHGRSASAFLVPVLVGLVALAFLLPPGRSLLVRLERRLFPPRAVPLERIDEATARSLFQLDRIGDAFRYDPVAILLSRPDREERWSWEEHPDGGFVMRTNPQGFVESEPTSVEKHGTRILVAGDSHTQGIANCDETFPNVLEALLNGDDPGGGGRGPEGMTRPVEVINAGVGYTGPYCYAARLRKYLVLQPDVFVAALFTGNDFWDDLLIRYTLDGVRWPRGGDEYRRRLDAARARFPGMISQGLNQAARFARFPAEADRAFSQVVSSFEEMKALCDANGIRFVALVLPTKIDVDLDDRPGELAQALALLGLTREEAGVNRLLGRRFAAEMDRLGIECLDPTEEMRASATVLYWRRDDHLAVAGHAFVAERLRRLLSTP